MTHKLRDGVYVLSIDGNEWTVEVYHLDKVQWVGYNAKDGGGAIVLSQVPESVEFTKMRLYPASPRAVLCGD